MGLRALVVSLLALLAGPAAAAGAPDAPDPRVATLVRSVRADRLKSDLTTLAAFGTRHTLSRTDAPGQGIGAAREWIRRELSAAGPRLQVSFESWDLPAQGERIPRDVELRNVVAVLPGRSPRRVYLTAHYDTVARPAPRGAADARGGFDWSKADGPAPGVNDDGSGTALVLELARVFAESGLEFEATLVFVAFAGEEEGLVGSTLHARRLAEQKVAVEAVLNNDIVGGPGSGQGRQDTAAVRVFSEGPEDSPSRQLARAVRRHAAAYVPGHEVRLRARPDRFLRGGDHLPFNQQGYAAVRFTEARENYSRQHTVDDTLEGVDVAYLARNAQVNAAAAAVIALAPPAPRVTDERGQPMLDRGPTGYDARVRWARAPAATSYRVYWREAWLPDWQHRLDVGDVEEAVLPSVSIDDVVLGVAAVSAGGHESLVSAYVAAERPPADVRTR